MYIPISKIKTLRRMKAQEETLVVTPTATTKDPIIIKDVIVADPSISVTFTSAAVVKDFQVSFFLNQMDETQKKVFKLVAKVHVQILPAKEHYISVPFGDNLYQPGTQFDLIMEFQGQDPITGLPIPFPNPVKLKVISGGIVSN
jgi:hypothetical protein